MAGPGGPRQRAARAATGPCRPACAAEMVLAEPVATALSQRRGRQPLGTLDRGCQFGLRREPSARLRQQPAPMAAAPRSHAARRRHCPPSPAPSGDRAQRQRAMDQLGGPACSLPPCAMPERIGVLAPDGGVGGHARDTVTARSKAATAASKRSASNSFMPTAPSRGRPGLALQVAHQHVTPLLRRRAAAASRPACAASRAADCTASAVTPHEGQHDQCRAQQRGRTRCGVRPGHPFVSATRVPGSRAAVRRGAAPGGHRVVEQLDAFLRDAHRLVHRVRAPGRGCGSARRWRRSTIPS